MIERGHIYQFNNAVAKVDFVDPSTIFWFEAEQRGTRFKVSRRRRITPKWFFEKHAYEIKQEDGR